MSVDIGFYAVVEKDTKYDEMFLVMSLCDKNLIPVPDEVEKYFNKFDDFNADGGRVGVPQVRTTNANCCEWEIDLSKLPEGTKRIIVGMY